MSKQVVDLKVIFVNTQPTLQDKPLYPTCKELYSEDIMLPSSTPLLSESNYRGSVAMEVRCWQMPAASVCS